MICSCCESRGHYYASPGNVAIMLLAKKYKNSYPCFFSKADPGNKLSIILYNSVIFAYSVETYFYYYDSRHIPA